MLPPSLLFPPGTRVGVVLPSGPSLAVLLLDCWKRGLVAVPINPKSPDSVRDFVLEHAEVHLVVDLSGTRQIQDAELSPAEDRLLIYTSGSTGNPKGVVLTRGAIEHNATAVAAHHGFLPGDVHATCLPLFHCNALCMSLLGTYIAGAELVLAPAEPAAYFAAINASGARTASLVPAILRRIVEASLPWPPSLHYFITAAAPLSGSLAAAFRELYGPGRLVQGYGMTEAVNFSCVMPILQGEEWDRAYLVQTPPVGLALPGTDLRIARPERAGKSGEVELHGPNLLRCYWRNEEATRAAFTPDGWLRTGDLGELEHGVLLTLRGREKEIIKQGGGTLYPADVEEVLRSSGYADPVVAFAVETSSGDEEIGVVAAELPGPPPPGICISAICRNGDDCSDPAHFRLFRGRLQAYRPMFFEEVAPETTATGKPRRKAMSARAVCETEDPARYEALVWAARETAEKLRLRASGSEAAAFIEAQARVLLAAPAPEYRTRIPGPAFQALDALVEAWPRLSKGELRGEDIFQAHPGLWKALMTEWPMGSYAQLAARFLRARSLLRGRILELGAGVGNTTRLIIPDLEDPTRFVRSDLFPRILAPDLPGHRIGYDFDQLPPPELRALGPFDCIFGTNTLHCARNPDDALEHLRELLVPGGVLLLAEGSPEPLPGIPWALTFLFGTMSGWYDRGGFWKREEWLKLLGDAGFVSRGYSVLRAGRYDLGGLVWAHRRQ